MKAPRKKPKVVKKPAKKRTTESPGPANNEDLDDSESEVELDSLGSFFMHLIDNDHYQDDAEASHAGGVEVTILSSDSAADMCTCEQSIGAKNLERSYAFLEVFAK